ncbi:Exopolysaccharide biosynthesis protein [Campylobacter jejuni]|nr:Exopolysaccharide biosynthesis protein [Campylobacter jejuni]
MKNILIVNESCSDNIGDHAINFGAKKLVEQCGFIAVNYGFDADKKNERPVIIKNETRISSVKGKIRKVLISNNQILKYFVWAIRNVSRIKRITNGSFHAVIIGGGQLVQTGGTFPIAMYLWIFFCSYRNIPVYILGVGCAERFSAIDKWLFRKSFARTKGIYVRDNASVEKLKLFFNVKANYIPDLAYALYDGSKNHKENITVIGATAYYVYLKNLKEIAQPITTTLDDYIQLWVNKVIAEVEGGNKVLLASTTIQDAVLNKLVFEQVLSKKYNGIGNNEVEILFDVPTTFEYIEILKKSKKISSGRMHSLILGHISGCELEPYNINKKIELYMDEYSTKDPKNIHTMLEDIFIKAVCH